MELSWFIFLVSVSICLFIRALLNLVSTQPKLPPGPTYIPILSTLQLILKRPKEDIEQSLNQLFSKYGPVVLLRVAGRKSIFIRSPELAYKTLVTHGSTFADRLPSSVASLHFNSNQHSIHTAAYGPLWRVLRRNLTSEILHPSRIKSFAPARKWVLEVLFNNLKQESSLGSKSVCVVDHFNYAMFCLIVYMLFGDKLDHEVIKQIESIQREIPLSYGKFNILNSMPRLSKILFRKRWNLLYELRSKQESILIPLIRARKENKNKQGVVAYVDTLENLSLPDGARKLTEQEMVSLCAELLHAGADTTSTMLQWIMANLVKHQDIQAKLFEEINANSSEKGVIKEEDLQKMPYLKAIVLEGLRRHPPSPFVVPHAVTEDTLLDGYVVPKDATINFMVAEMGWDPNVWEEPMQFRPERFLRSENGEAFDITGKREIKMMPFGAGRRICPAFGLAIFQLEYLVANLIKGFKWTAEEGDDVDLSEKTTSVKHMKNPLRAQLTAR